MTGGSTGGILTFADLVFRRIRAELFLNRRELAWRAALTEEEEEA